ncbi:MAG: hypothetical protein LBL08_02795, partial [Candidatus Nomurabacteria bacterium]|nr:hypothetical protein [Candidatus Nomurabacteria bacterium]
SDNGFYCWGDDTSGQLGGDGVAGEATELMSWGAALPIASGYAHSCAGFWCIGENGSGQLGDGSTVNRDEMTSVDLSGVLAGLSVKDVVAGFDFTCWVAGEAGTGLLDAAFCSGAGVDGQLGDNLNNNSDVPVAVDFSQVEREETYVNLSTDVNKVELTVQPSGSVAAGAVNLTVVTNNFKGYDLSIKTDNENLVCQDNASYVIAKQSPDGAALAVNHWGYETGPTEPAAWNGVTTSDVTIDSLGTATSESGQPTKAWFGAKADFSLPACVYNGTATFTAVAVV